MGVADEVSPTVQLELLRNAGAIGLHAFDAHVDLLSDLPVRIALRQANEYFTLPWA